jgi:hypothetical protein
MTHGCVLVFGLVYEAGGAYSGMPKSKSQTEEAYNIITMYGNIILLN